MKNKNVELYWKQNTLHELIKLYENARALRILVRHPKTKSSILTKFYKMENEKVECLNKFQKLINEGFELKEIWYR